MEKARCIAYPHNRTVQHNPLNDYHGERREMHQVILRGERPHGVGS